MNVTAPNWAIAYAAQTIRKGGVIAYPTESVWGLGCDPSNDHALERLLALKQRPVEKGLILVSGQVEHFYFLLRELPSAQLMRFLSVPKRPTTWLVPDVNNKVSAMVKGRFSSVALRVSHHPSLSSLTQRLGYPIVSTSANPAGRTTASTRLKLVQYFGSELDYILPVAQQGGHQASTIKDLVSGKVVRA